MAQRRGWAVGRAATATIAVAAALALVGTWQGHASAVMALAGSMAVLYGRGEPYVHRARTVGSMGLLIAGMTTCASLAAGSNLALLGVLTGCAALAALATHVLRAPIPGPTLLLVPTTIVCAIPLHDLVGLEHRVAMVALGAAVALIVALGPVVLRPDRPERRVLAAGFRAVGETLVSLGSDTFEAARATAWASLDEAHHSLDLARSIPGSPRRSQATLWMLFRQATAMLIRADTSRREGPDGRLAADDLEICIEIATLLDKRGSLTPPRSASSFSVPAVLSLLARRDDAVRAALTSDAHPEGARPRYSRMPASRQSAWLPIISMLRLATVVLACGSTAIGLGLDRWYWAPVSAVATLWGTNSWITWHRAAQRAIATVVGCGAGLLLLHLPLDYAGTVAIVAALFFIAELYFPRNYGFALAPVTAMILILIQAGSPVAIASWAVAEDRVIAVLLGSAFGLAAVLLVWPTSATRNLKRMIAKSRQLQQRILSRMDSGPLGSTAEIWALRYRLRRDLVALHAAAGEALGEGRARHEAVELSTESSEVQRLAYQLITDLDDEQDSYPPALSREQS